MDQRKQKKVFRQRFFQLADTLRSLNVVLLNNSPFKLEPDIDEDTLAPWKRAQSLKKRSAFVHSDHIEVMRERLSEARTKSV